MKNLDEVMDDVSSEDGEHELEDIEMYNGTPGDSVGSTPLESGLLPHCTQLEPGREPDLYLVPALAGLFNPFPFQNP